MSIWEMFGMAWATVFEMILIIGVPIIVLEIVVVTIHEIIKRRKKK